MTQKKTAEVMKKVYRCEVTVVLYVVAENSVQARDLAEMHMAEEAHNAEHFIVECETLGRIDKEWRNSLPYNGDGETFIRDMFAEAKP